MSSATTSPADAAHPVFQELCSQRALLRAEDPDLSEADTRAKLIDPVFTRVLGWAETQIIREDPIAAGFADYSFGLPYKWFHVEAKRTLPRFNLHAPSKNRWLKLSGPHLLGNREVRPQLEQTAKYSHELGTQFAVLTNGSQWILFEASPRGHSWKDADAYVFHDHDDISNSFAEFFSILSPQAVESGSLTELFSPATAITRPTYIPLQYIHNPDAELIRNRFWNAIAATFFPLLTDQPENALLQEEIIRNCYVTSPLAEESTQQLGILLRDIVPVSLRDTGIEHIEHGGNKAGAFRSALWQDIQLQKLTRATPGTYVLTGGVGSGKTTFLRHFATVDQKDFIEQHCVWLHIDFLVFGQSQPSGTHDTIEDYAYARILEILSNNYPNLLPTTAQDMRALFAPELHMASITRLSGLQTNSPEYGREVSAIISELSARPEKYVHAILRRIKEAGRSIVFVLDNTDQQGEEFQKRVFLFSQKLSSQLSTLSIVSLREEKYFAAFSQGLLDAYGTRKFHIGSPNLIKVLRKRLEYGLRRYEQQAILEGVEAFKRRATRDVAHTLVQASTTGNSNIIRFLSCVSNGDMRLALTMFRDFMSSGNTDVEKITRVVRRGEAYKVPFHEFAKSAILGARRYYRSSVSHIVNLFSLSPSRNASHWTACRVLARLLTAQTASSVHGEGFVSTANLLREYRESFGVADDFIQTCDRLLRSGLLESEPPRCESTKSTQALRITPTGAYYWSFLVRSFAYHDLVLVDTPLLDDNLAKQLAGLSDKCKEDYPLPQFIRFRIRRVQSFVDYLAKQDQAEIQISSRKGGLYTELLSTVIQAQLAKEIPLIRDRTGA